MAVEGILGTPEHVSLEIDGQSYEVVSLKGEERLSQLFRFEIECAIEGEGPDPDTLLGSAAIMTLRDGFGTERRMSGMVAEATQRSFDNDKGALLVVVRPLAYKLLIGRDSRAFQDATVVDIVKQVVLAAGCPTRWSTTQSYPTRVYTVQYREDDWTFVARLLEEEGIYYWFDHNDDSTLVFADDSTAAPDLSGGAEIVFAYESGMQAESEIIEELGSGTSATATKFSVGSFDPVRPLFKVAANEGDGALEIYDAPGGGPESPAVIAARAKTMKQQAAAARHGVAGLTTSVRLVPGMVFDVVNHPLAKLDQRYLVTGATYVVAQRRRGDASAGRKYTCRFTAIRQNVPYRAPAESPLAMQSGLQSGVVIGEAGAEVFPDPMGRVRVQQHWDRLGKRDPFSGKWMRVAQRGSADSMLLPRIGWTVLTFNEEGTVDAPSIISRIHDGEHLPPYALPGNMTRLVFKTATTPGGGSFNEIRYEDKKGSEEMFIDASKDMTVLVQHLKVETVENDQQRKVGVNHDLTVGGMYAETVDGNQTVTIGGNRSITAMSGKSKSVKGDETETIGGSRNLSVGGGFSLSTEKNRNLTVGAAMLDITLGQMAATGGLCTTLVGGAMVRLATGAISEDVGKVGTQLIGGARIELAKQNRSLDVKKRYFETVGGAMILKTNGTYIDGADKTSSWMVGGPMKGKAPSILVEAKDKIELKCGGSVITILPKSIEISSPEFALDDSKNLALETKLVEHNK